MERDDLLRAMAGNRGCKLVKSRRRKAGGDFGRYGLKDAATGKEVFGFGADGLTATPEEIETYLRGSVASEWQKSLREAAGGSETTARLRSAPKEEKKAKAAPPPPPPPPPTKPSVREARPADVEAISALIGELGWEASAAEIKRRLGQLRTANEVPLVAVQDDVIGCVTWHVMHVLHRPHPVGRITVLVVAEAKRGEGVGRQLVEAAARRLRERGCGILEVTSNVKLEKAHDFYRHLGFERTSYRFAKELGD